MDSQITHDATNPPWAIGVSLRLHDQLTPTGPRLTAGFASGLRLIGRRVRCTGGDEPGDLRTGHLVLSVGVENVGDEDAGIVVLVGTRHGDKRFPRGNPLLISANQDLGTTGVELGAAGLCGEMEGDDLVLDQVAARCEVLGQGNRCDATIKELLLLPFAVFAPGFVDFEPLHFGRVNLGTALIATRCQIGEHGTCVVRPVATGSGEPLERELAPWVRIVDFWGGFGINAAVYGGVVGALDGVLNDNLPYATRPGVGFVEAGSFVLPAIDCDFLENAMGRDEWEGGGESENESGGGLHVE